MGHTLLTRSRGSVVAYLEYASSLLVWVRGFRGKTQLRYADRDMPRLARVVHQLADRGEVRGLKLTEPIFQKAIVDLRGRGRARGSGGARGQRQKDSRGREWWRERGGVRLPGGSGRGVCALKRGRERRAGALAKNNSPPCCLC